MKVRWTASIGLLVAVLFSSIALTNLQAQAKKSEQANVQGIIQNVSKDASTVTVKTNESGNR
ncbi:MAG: hypothetical protein ACHQX3_11180, partial [Nitrospirales bacterium]